MYKDNSFSVLVYKSCKEIYNDDPSSATGVYDLETGKHFCYMESSSGSCGVGGWTLALKVDGTKVSHLPFNMPHSLQLQFAESY